jgi:hypothetical protein
LVASKFIPTAKAINLLLIKKRKVSLAVNKNKAKLLRLSFSLSLEQSKKST